MSIASDQDSVSEYSDNDSGSSSSEEIMEPKHRH